MGVVRSPNTGKIHLGRGSAFLEAKDNLTASVTETHCMLRSQSGALSKKPIASRNPVCVSGLRTCGYWPELL